MNSLLKGLIAGTFLLIMTTGAFAAQLNGTVVKVENLDVIVKVDGELMPSKGDQIELSFAIPDGESISIGTWEINRVTGNMAIAAVKNNTGNPVVGHKAVIFSENPMPQINPQKKEPHNTYTGSDSRTSTSSLGSDVQQVVDQMRSSSSGTKRNGAKIAYRRHLDSPEVIAVAAEELKKGYKINWNDKYHVDAMAWMCNILGASYDEKYIPLLRKIYKEKGSKKIRAFAKKNYKKLR